MELCPKCKRMTAEKSHYTGIIICYNTKCESETQELENGKQIEIWFNPYDMEHLKAYKTLRDTGTWPKDFIPKGTKFGPGWHSLIAFKIAECWILYKLASWSIPEPGEPGEPIELSSMIHNED